MAAKPSARVLPLAREELDVQRRTVERARIRIRKSTRKREARVKEPVSRDQVQVERVAINRPLERPLEPRYEGDVLVVPVMEEVLVVRKQLMLKEELRVRKRTVRSLHEERVVLRSEEVSIDREERRNRSTNLERK